MFLFTTPPRQQEALQADQHPVARSVRSAAEATGVSFDYLMRTAKRESNLNPEAKASSSSATGLFQFIEQTWLGLVKKEGARLGLQAEADAISQDRSGRYTVSGAQDRQKILGLRKDPEVSSKLAGVFTQKNKNNLRDNLGRDPNSAELYMAHFLGSQGASELIKLAESNPAGSAAKSFPDAAASNRSIFFDGKGRARTNREVYARLSSFHSGVDPGAGQGVAVASAETQDGPPTRSPLAIGIPRNMTETGQIRANNALHGLFRNGGDTASAKALRKAWGGFAEARLNKDAPSFFPRNAGVQVASVSPDQVMGTMSDVAPPSPLAGFEAVAPVEVAKKQAELPQAKTRRVATGKPLDLTKFLKIKR